MLLQYQHIALALAGLYGKSSGSRLAITNFKYTALMAKGEIDKHEDSYHYLTRFEALRKALAGTILISSHSLSYLSNQAPDHLCEEDDS